MPPPLQRPGTPSGVITSQCKISSLRFRNRHCKCRRVLVARRLRNRLARALRQASGRRRDRRAPPSDRNRSDGVRARTARAPWKDPAPLTLESLAWLRAISASLIHLSANGHVLTHSMPFGYDGHPIRRAQALSIATGLDVQVAHDLIDRKLAGQRANLVRLRVANLGLFDAMRAALDLATSIDEIRPCEAKAAVIYWNAWSAVPIPLCGRDPARVPVKWTRYDSRASALTNGPRAATNPVNALLNYVYSLLESETRLALLAQAWIRRLACCTRTSATAARSRSMRWNQSGRRSMPSCSISLKSAC